MWLSCKLEYLKLQVYSSTSRPPPQAFSTTPLQLHDHFILTSISARFHFNSTPIHFPQFFATPPPWSRGRVEFKYSIVDPYNFLMRIYKCNISLSNKILSLIYFFNNLFLKFLINRYSIFLFFV